MPVFRPFLLKKDVTAISVEMLKAWGAKAVLLDVDNTLTSHNSQGLSKEIAAWLDAVRAAGITPVIVSNGKALRVRPFAEKLGFPLTASAKKPLPIGFLRAKKQLGLQKNECVVIGDQLFTDVLGGKFAGMRVIQTLPLDVHSDTGFIRFKRKLEKIIMRKWEVSV